MRDYCIITESTCDLTQELADRLDLTILPMTFTVENKLYHNYLDGRELDIQEFYRLQSEGKSVRTAQVTSIQFEELFSEKIEQGLDVLCINFSSGLSGTFHSAQTAAAAVREKYPEAKLYTVDSKAASVGQGLLVYHAGMLKKEGKSIEEVAAFAEEKRLNVCHWFTVGDLGHLKRGGRISPAAARIGSILDIKPILHVDNDGKLQAIGKIRGREPSIRELVNRMEKSFPDDQPQVILIGHGDCLEEALKLEEIVRSRIPVADVHISYVGPVIGTHTGPGMLAAVNLGTRR